MNVGDLVKLKKEINHATGTYKPGLIGLIVESQEPTPRDPRGHAEVKFEHAQITCYWRELELISEISFRA